MTHPSRGALIVLVANAVMSVGPSWSADVADPKVTEKIRVLILNKTPTACAHAVEQRSLFLHRRNSKPEADAIGWRLRNTCSMDQDVLLCVYSVSPPNDLMASPFHRCDPTAFDVGAKFSIAARTGRVDVDCAARQDGVYAKVVLIGDSLSMCPTTMPKDNGHSARTHKLDVVILP